MARKIESIGGDINAWTSFDETVYHIVVPKEELATGIDVLVNAVQNPLFEAKELASEKEVIFEEISQGKDDPSHLCIENLFNSAYRSHPYGRPIIGFRKTLENISSRDLARIHNKYYSAENVTVVIAGDVDAGKCRRLLQRRISGFPKNKKKTHTFSPAKQKRLQFSVVDARDINEIQAAVGFHIPRIQHEDGAALDLLALILGHGESSRLHSTLKKEANLVTDVFANAYTLKESGLFAVAAGVQPDRLEKATEALIEELFKTFKEKVTDEELERAIRIALSEKVYGAETAQGLARKLGYYGTATGDPDYERKYLSRIKVVTKSELRATAEKYIRPNNLTFSLVLPKAENASQKETGQIKKRIKSFARDLIKEKFKTGISTTTVSASQKKVSPIQAHELSCGGKVIVLPDSSVPLVAFRSIWLGGLRAETMNNNGINCLLTGMLTRGSTKYPVYDGIRAIEGFGGSMSGAAGRNTLGLRAEVLSEHWEPAFDVIVDTLTNPTLDESELNKERKNTIDEIAAQEDNPAYQAYRAFRVALYGKHPYSMSVMGTRESLMTLTKKKLASFHRRFMRPQDMVISVVGDIDPERTVEIFETAFPDQPKTKKGVLPKRALPKFSKPRKVRIQKDRQQSHIVLGFHGLTIQDERRFALEVLVAVLSGQGGRLFRELRDKRGMAYHVTAANIDGLDPGFLSVYMATSPEKVKDAVDGIRDELRKVSERVIGAQELEETKRHLAGNHAISLQRKSALAGNIALNEIYNLGYNEHTRYRENILSVTADDVIDVARYILRPSHEVLSIVTPKDS